ncbi:unnamed protein product [Rotaria sordida]|uniref:Uncharacterized protein n=1 Tax=Rotaria sordida TaxID=392033 RepID=A0A813Y517_9BILA|nr:unnamed protein product [Rotaria sordida]
MMDPYPPPVFIIPGMKVGCMPYDAFLGSNLECFFSATCLNNTARWISSLPASDWPKPLNSSAMLNFLPNTSTLSIVDQFLIDHWNITKNFSSYFTFCAPTECTYKVEQYNSFIYALTLLIGCYGGLIVGLRVIAPLIVKFSQHIYGWFLRKTQMKIHPTETQQGITKK